jgi:hypothetical protein
MTYFLFPWIWKFIKCGMLLRVKNIFELTQPSDSDVVLTSSLESHYVLFLTYDDNETRNTGHGAEHRLSSSVTLLTQGLTTCQGSAPRVSILRRNFLNWTRYAAVELRKCSNPRVYNDETSHNYVRYEILTAVAMNVAIFWDIYIYMYMWTDVSEEHIISIFKAENQHSKKGQFTYGLHGATSHNMTIFIP